MLWPNGWMDQDATWYEGRPRPWPHWVRWGPSSTPPVYGPCPLWALCYMRTQLPPQKKTGEGTAPNVLPMSIVTKRSPISATAEHLSSKNRRHFSLRFRSTGIVSTTRCYRKQTNVRCDFERCRFSVARNFAEYCCLQTKQ